MPARNPARWLGTGCTVLTLTGAAVSLYLTIAHYNAHLALACPSTGVVNCQQVTTSSYSSLFGVPVALLGLTYFALLVPLHLPVAWRSAHLPVRAGRMALATIGAGMVVWLVYAERAGTAPFRVHGVVTDR
jgi:uncharacterized membrane protein